MKEDFLHYLWKYKKFDLNQLKTTQSKTLVVLFSGHHNFNSGPDFFNAQLKINKQHWAGNVEIHLKSSDWFAHHHEVDKAYDNVILHVVWEHDTEVYTKNNIEIDTLELKRYVSKEALNSYQKLFNKKKQWINCESDFCSVDDFTMSNWIERLYFERLERKSEEIMILLKASNNDWEAVLFKMLAKNFGLRVNGDAFKSLASSIEFSIVRKVQANLNNLEALLFGQAGLLELDTEDAYFNELIKRYVYQSQKFNLSNASVLPIQFFRLRPPNFPTIRLSQLANLYYSHHNLFSKLIDAKRVNTIYKLLQITTSLYWETHYSFGKSSKKMKKVTTEAFIDLLIINTVIPLKFTYSKYLGKSIDSDITKLIVALKPEKNSIVESFNDLKKGVSKNAMHSQALIELKQNYCNKNKCLQCAVGNVILSN